MEARPRPRRARAAARLACLALALLSPAGACSRSGGGAAPARSLLLVSVDTLRADRLGAYGDPRGLTPHLDALARESSVFERAYAPAPFTLPSVAALLTGRYPEEAGVRTNAAVVSEALPTLATWLRAHGWRTGAAVGNFVLRSRAGLARGFELYDESFAPRARGEAPERDAASLTDAALALLDALWAPESPLFLWVHYQDPHGPYAPPDADRAPLLAGERERADGRLELPRGPDDRGLASIPRYQYREGRHEVAYYRAGYAAEVRSVDAQLGRLLREIAPGGRLADAVVIFTADHGESLGERDQWFAHGELLSDAVLRVPLLIRVPGRAPERRRDLASLLDVAPTAAALLGLPPPPGLRGRDLFAAPPATAPALYASSLLESSRPRLALIEAEHRVVLAPSAAGAGARELFRLGDDAEDLAAARPEQVRAMARRLQALRAALELAPPTRQRLSDAEREALRDLGYASDPSGSP
jgi:arylsulfatase